MQLPRRNASIEYKAFHPLRAWGMSRNAPQCGVNARPETPHRFCVHCANQRLLHAHDDSTENKKAETGFSGLCFVVSLIVSLRRIHSFRMVFSVVFSSDYLVKVRLFSDSASDTLQNSPTPRQLNHHALADWLHAVADVLNE